MPEDMHFQTRDQRFASAIFKQVSKIKESEKSQYASMAHKLPVLIRTAGLAQALSFVEARHKANTPARNLLTHLNTVLNNENLINGDLANKSRTTSNLGEYMRLTQNVLAALHWYKRFAQSVLGIDASQAQGSEDDADQNAETGTNAEAV